MTPAPGSGAVLVTGATGVVGPAVVAHLLAERREVRALVRSPAAPLPEGVVPVVGDLGDDDALRRAVDGVGAVVHLAARLHVNRPGADLEPEYRRTNVDATRRLAGLAADAGVVRFVHASTISVYGRSPAGQVVAEGDAPAPETLYARTKLEAEAALDGPAEVVVLRTAAVVGPGMKGNYPVLARVLARGLPVLPGDGTNRRTLVHVDDAGRAFALAATGALPVGTFNLTDGRIHRFDEVVRAIQRSQGRRPGVHYVPARALRLAVGGSRTRAGLLVDKLTEDIAVSGDRLAATGAWAPARSALAHWDGDAPR